MKPPIALLFVCHGNICRSPMAEFVMKDLVHRAGVGSEYVIASAATSTEELGNGVYPPARQILAAHGLSCAGKTARQITMEDYRKFDLLIGMDQRNLRNMLRFFGGDPDHKIRLLLAYTGRPEEEVDDPWYSGDFHQAWDDIVSGCNGLFRRLSER